MRKRAVANSPHSRLTESRSDGCCFSPRRYDEAVHELRGVLRAVAEFTALIFRNMKTHTDKFPSFSDEALKKLTKPVMAILAGRDAFIDSPRVKARLERNVSNIRVLYLPEARHAITNQTAPILHFLRASHES